MRRRLALLDHIAGTTDGSCRVHCEDLAHDQPVEQHANGREVLLDGRWGAMCGHLGVRLEKVRYVALRAHLGGPKLVSAPYAIEAGH